MVLVALGVLAAGVLYATWKARGAHDRIDLLEGKLQGLADKIPPKPPDSVGKLLHLVAKKPSGRPPPEAS